MDWKLHHCPYCPSIHPSIHISEFCGLLYSVQAMSSTICRQVLHKPVCVETGNSVIYIMYPGSPGWTCERLSSKCWVDFCSRTLAYVIERLPNGLKLHVDIHVEYKLMAKNIVDLSPGACCLPIRTRTFQEWSQWWFEPVDLNLFLKTFVHSQNTIYKIEGDEMN